MSTFQYEALTPVDVSGDPVNKRMHNTDIQEPGTKYSLLKSANLEEGAVIERLPQTSPADEFNHELVRNVHPLDWANPEPTGRYHLVVIGAGPIGCEMAQAFARLGSEVFLVEAEHGILPREDRDAAAIVQETIVRDGVRLLCCGKNLEVRQDGKIRLIVESHGQGYDEPIERKQS